MKRTLLFLVISGTAALIITGCSKKSDTQAATMKNLAGTYKLTAYTATSGGVTIDGMQNMDACQKDDQLKLNADSTLNYIDAGTTCSPDGSYTGSWVVSGNYLILDGSDSSTIKSFNGSTLVVTFNLTYQGSTVVNTQTLTKQ